MTKTKNGMAALVRRRAKRGRPRKDEQGIKVVTKPVFVARDPQGVKLFAAAPKLTVLGLWQGQLIGGTKPMDPRSFVNKFRNARLPGKGGVLEMRMAVQ